MQSRKKCLDLVKDAGRRKKLHFWLLGCIVKQQAISCSPSCLWLPHGPCKSNDEKFDISGLSLTLALASKSIIHSIGNRKSLPWRESSDSSNNSRVTFLKGSFGCIITLSHAAWRLVLLSVSINAKTLRAL